MKNISIWLFLVLLTSLSMSVLAQQVAKHVNDIQELETHLAIVTGNKRLSLLT